MRRFARHILFIVCSLSALAIGCKKEATSNTGSTTPSTEETATSSAAVKTARASVGPPPAGGSLVIVEFKNTMAVLRPTNGDPIRAVALTGKNHSGSMHDVRIFMPPVKMSASDFADLEKVVGGAGAIRCNAKRCRIDPTLGLTVEVVDKNGAKVSPSPMKTTYLFDAFVPNLQTVTKDYADVEQGGSGTPELADLDPVLKDRYPPTGGDFSLYFELTGGELDAKSACGLGRFQRISDSLYSGYRRFPSSISLSGTTATEATVVFTSSAGSKAATFDDPSFVQIFIVNGPRNLGMNHFEILRDLGATKKIKMPTIDDTKSCEGEVKADVIGCSASQWP